MAEQTIHERVTQAISRDVELMKAAQEASALAQEARAELNRTKHTDFLNSQVEEVNENYQSIINKADKLLAEKKAKAHKEYEDAMGPLELAIKKVEEKLPKDVSSAEAIYDKTKTNATESRDKEISEYRSVYDLAVLDAQAEAYRAEREALAVQATLDQSRQNIKDELGINLAAYSENS